MKPPQVVLHTAQKEHVLPLVRLGQDLVRDAERLLIVPLTPLGQAEKRQTVQLMKAIMDVTGNAHDPPGRGGWLAETSPASRLLAEGPQGGDKGVFVTLPTADLEGRGELPVRFLHVPTPLLDQTKAGEAAGKDFGIPKALRQLLRLLGVLFGQREMVFRLLLVMGMRQMTEAFSLLARLPGRACHLAHALKIRNRRIVFSQQKPDAPALHTPEAAARRLYGRRDPLAHLQRLRVEGKRFLVGIHLAGFVP